MGHACLPLARPHAQPRPLTKPHIALSPRPAAPPARPRPRPPPPTPPNPCAPHLAAPRAPPRAAPAARPRRPRPRPRPRPRRRRSPPRPRPAEPRRRRRRFQTASGWAPAGSWAARGNSLPGKFEFEHLNQNRARAGWIRMRSNHKRRRPSLHPRGRRGRPPTRRPAHAGKPAPKPRRRRMPRTRAWCSSPRCMPRSVARCAHTWGGGRGAHSGQTR